MNGLILKTKAKADGGYPEKNQTITLENLLILGYLSGQV